MVGFNIKEFKIEQFDPEYFSNFLVENNFTKEPVSCKLVYGIKFENVIIQAIAFDNPRFDKNFQYELVYEFINPNHQINDNLNDLWDYFIKNNNVRSCVCYSYTNGDYIDRYVKNCSFNTIEPNEDILNAVDINEEYKLQVDSYFPFGVVYKITDLNDGKFYIGKCEVENRWNNGYKGSGTRWVAHMNAHPDHNYKREILKSGFNSPKDLYKAEFKVIKQFCSIDDCGNLNIIDQDCMNLLLTEQGGYPGFFSPSEICSECGGGKGSHKSWCSKYNTDLTCPECGGTNGSHKRTCSKSKRNVVCSECGGVYNFHKKGCPQYKEWEPCPECGVVHGHLKTCSKYGKVPCPECGSLGFSHRKTCSKYKPIEKCKECGSPVNSHKKTCSQYIAPVECSECGAKRGHKKTCSKYKQPVECPECGAKYNHHKPTCSKYTVKICPECGGKGGHHNKTCTHYKEVEICDECGSPVTSHKKSCSKCNKKQNYCPECGSKGRTHKRTCSKYVPPKPCSECGKQFGHLKSCSKYKSPKGCPECGSKTAHYKTCSKYKDTTEVCPECGGKRGHHKSSCLFYKQ